jgi:hypothetical protein
VRGLPRAWSARDAALAAWLCGWLAFGAVAGMRGLFAALRAAEPVALGRALATPLDERVRVALNPFGYEVFQVLAGHVAPGATAYLVSEPSPAMHRMWLGLSTWLYPLVVVPLPAGTPLPPGATAVVIGRAGDPPPSADARRVDAGPGPVLWLVEPRAR